MTIMNGQNGEMYLLNMRGSKKIKWSLTHSFIYAFINIAMVKPRQHQILYEDEGNGAAFCDFYQYVGRSLTRAQSFVSRSQAITTS